MNLVKGNRRKVCSKYMERFIQGLDYRELTKAERKATRKRYKYEMLADRMVFTKVTGYLISHEYFELYEDGRLLIKKGYRWDGPSGVTLDTASFMRSSCVHDVFFQCLRENLFMLIIVPPHLLMKEVGEWKRLFTLSNRAKELI